MACAVRPRRRALGEAQRRADVARRPRNAAPAPPSGPVTTSTSPGCAPARPGTRSERPTRRHAEHDLRRGGRVAADDRDAGLGHAAVQLEHVVDARLARRRASVTTSASARRRTRRGRSGSPPPRASRGRATTCQSRRKWTSSTSASWVTTTPPASCAASCSTPAIRPRRSSSASRPSSPTCESLIDRPPQRGIRRRADRPRRRPRRRECTRRRSRRRCRRSPPPGTATAAQIAREPVEAERAGRRPPSTASPRSGRRRGSRRPPRRACSKLDGGAAEQQPRLARALGARVGLAEVHAVGAELERRVDVVVDDEGRRRARGSRAPRATTSSVGAFTRSWTTVAPAVDRATRRLEVADDRVNLSRHLRPPVERRPGRAPRARRRAPTWNEPGPFASRPRPRRRRRRRRAPRPRARAATRRRRGSSR